MYKEKSAQAIASKKHYEKNKEARLAANKARRDKLRQTMRDLKNGPCMDCGIKYPYYVMQFDHRPDEIKLYTPAKLFQVGSPRLLLEEVAKCDLVCANCHAERTFQRATEGE